MQFFFLFCSFQEAIKSASAKIIKNHPKRKIHTQKITFFDDTPQDYVFVSLERK